LVIAENPGATFHHASAGEGLIFLYIRDKDTGLWYLPGSGVDCFVKKRGVGSTATEMTDPDGTASARC
jgi:hypothetical protein